MELVGILGRRHTPAPHTRLIPRNLGHHRTRGRSRGPSRGTQLLAGLAGLYQADHASYRPRHVVGGQGSLSACQRVRAHWVGGCLRMRSD